MQDDQDIIVVGAGLSGLATALVAAVRGYKVRILERADVLGGAAAYSGGMVWAPANHLARAQGVEDSPDAAARYVLSVATADAGENNYVDEAALRRYVSACPEAVKFFDDIGAVNWYLVPEYSDYEYPDADGSIEWGRFLAATFPAPELGEWREKLRVSPVFPMGTTYTDLFDAGEVGTTFGTSVDAATPGVSGEDLYTFGTGLVAGFLSRVLKEKSIFIELGSPATELIVEGGDVVGVRGADAAGSPFELHGVVVLATSGFDWNPELVKRFYGLSEKNFRSAAPKSIVGDGLTLAENAGAAIDVIPPRYIPLLMGFPVDDERGVVMSSEHCHPHAFVVDATGKRFADDSTYWGLTAGALEGDTPRECYMIWDSQHRRRYALGATAAGEEYPPGLVTSAETLRELGASLGIDGEELERTAARFNEFAANGEDPDFQRGRNRNWNLWNGDLEYDNPALGSVAEPPFYGMYLYYTGPAVPGTGVSVNSECQAKRPDGSVLRGLYAVGSCAVFSTSGAAHGGGFPLSRAITMPYIVASTIETDGVPATGAAVVDAASY